MNIVNRNRVLNESDRDVTIEIPKVSSSDKAKYQLNEIDNVFQHDSNLFRFSNGVKMANINIEIDNPISLNYHYKNSANFDDFISSIKGTLASIADKKISSADVERLRSEYKNQVERTLKSNKTISQQVAQILSNE